MIRYRCWYCDKLYYTPEERIGSRFVCTCGHQLKVPRRSGKSSRVKTLLDWAVEILVYGGGGAVLGLGLGALVTSRTYWLFRRPGDMLLAFTLLGFLFGTFGGERGVNWIGRLIREREQR